MPSRASAWTVDDSTRRVVEIVESIGDGASRKSRSVGRSARVDAANARVDAHLGDLAMDVLVR